MLHRIYSLLATGLIFIACLDKRQPQNFDDASFNRMAAEQFKANFDEFDLELLPEQDKCILKEAVGSYLDELNNWRFVVVDSFYVRTYNLTELKANFAFIGNRSGQISFLYFPIFTDRTVHDLQGDKYYELRDGEMHLRNPTEAIVRMNSRMFDDFITRQVLDRKDPFKQYLQTDRLLTELLTPFTSKEIGLEDFETEIKVEPRSNQDAITRMLHPFTTKTGSVTRRANDFKILTVPFFGWIFINYSINQAYPQNIKVDMFLISKSRTGINSIFEVDRRRYRRCYE